MQFCGLVGLSVFASCRGALVELADVALGTGTELRGGSRVATGLALSASNFHWSCWWINNSDIWSRGVLLSNLSPLTPNHANTASNAQPKRESPYNVAADCDSSTCFAAWEGEATNVAGGSVGYLETIVTHFSQSSVSLGELSALNPANTFVNGLAVTSGKDKFAVIAGTEPESAGSRLVFAATINLAQHSAPRDFSRFTGTKMQLVDDFDAVLSDNRIAILWNQQAPNLYSTAMLVRIFSLQTNSFLVPFDISDGVDRIRRKPRLVRLNATHYSAVWLVRLSSHMVAYRLFNTSGPIGPLKYLGESESGSSSVAMTFGQGRLYAGYSNNTGVTLLELDSSGAIVTMTDPGIRSVRTPFALKLHNHRLGLLYRLSDDVRLKIFSGPTPLTTVSATSPTEAMSAPVTTSPVPSSAPSKIPTSGPSQTAMTMSTLRQRTVTVIQSPDPMSTLRQRSGTMMRSPGETSTPITEIIIGIAIAILCALGLTLAIRHLRSKRANQVDALPKTRTPVYAQADESDSSSADREPKYEEFELRPDGKTHYDEFSMAELNANADHY